MNKIIGLMPAAGKGERLGWPTPKELWPVSTGNTINPLIRYMIDHFSFSGVRHICVVTNNEKPEIMRYLSSIRLYSFSYVCQVENYGIGKSSGLVEAISSSYHVIKDNIVCFAMPDTLIRLHNNITEPLFNPLIAEVISGADIAFGCFKTTT